MRVGIDEDFIAWFRVGPQRQLIGHGAGRGEHGGFLAEELGHVRFEPRHGGVVPKHVISYFRPGHRLAHGGCGLRDRIAA